MEGNGSSRALRLLLVIVLCALLSGCLHVRAAMTISGEDTVSGEVLVATETPDGQVPFELRPPPEFADRVQVRPYAQGKRVGANLSFSDLSLQEVERLASAMSPADSRFSMRLYRTGSLVVFEGSADLTPLADTDSGIELKISAPGEITTTNGEESAGTVTWVLQPGEVTEPSATFQFSDGSGLEWIGWALLVGAGAAAAAVWVGTLALRNHLRTRPGARL
ncbi:DUF3153 domain-containing protein [Saccharopolyspora rhizosphaerae]|uniref:DUF3153 domain-containing protein n=1 Tax=Saccharopolyspora rhizosphaerae TaxID=2492662 RepID=A0A3R8NX39_9PSEU|nr:DUF3153 domain-containing protein [Saccharopolyspora rhizosphaerae]RRO14874.1 DUF3153 domain-containing protein [Saccharopolyspora rhizosphaerae]